MDKYKVAIVDDDEVALENLASKGKNSLPRYSRICCSWMWKCRI